MATNIMEYKLSDGNTIGFLVAFLFLRIDVVLGKSTSFSLINEIGQSTISVDCIPGSESKFRSNINSPEPYTHLSKCGTFDGIYFFFR